MGEGKEGVELEARCESCDCGKVVRPVSPVLRISGSMLYERSTHAVRPGTICFPQV